MSDDFTLSPLGTPYRRRYAGFLKVNIIKCVDVCLAGVMLVSRKAHKDEDKFNN